MRPRPKVKRVTGSGETARAEPVVVLDIGGQAAEVIDHGPVGDVIVGRLE